MHGRGGLCCALILAACGPAWGQTVIPGSQAINPANGHTYYLLTESAWDGAESAAVSLDGHLATINDPAENAWVYDTYGLFGNEPRSLWIGLNDAAEEGVYTWTGGEPSAYTYWAFTEPNNLNDEDYVHLFEPGEPLDRASYWNDNVMAGTGGGAATVIPNGVVEVVPEPATIVMILIVAMLLSRHWLNKRAAKAPPPPQRRYCVW